MTKQQFIGEYVQSKMTGVKIPYNMTYLNHIAKLEAEAEKLWKERWREIKQIK